MDKEYLRKFMTDFDYPKEAQAALVHTWDVLTANHNNRERFDSLISLYQENYLCDISVVTEKCAVIAQDSGESVYTVELLLLISLSKMLKKRYHECGIDERVWFDGMCDLKYKLLECRLVKGVWGTFVAAWLWKWFRLELFALGRLQFEMVPFKMDSYTKNEKHLSKGDPVINVHIPRTMTPLDRESCLASYDKAAIFFKKYFLGKPIAFVCDSWLLYPNNREILPPKSNIRSFMEDYDIIEYRESLPGDYSSMWRLFDMDYTGNVDDFPSDTSVRRNYIQHMKNGGRVGSGYGVFFYKAE